MPVWAIRYVLPALAVVAALWVAYSWAYARGRDAERAEWEIVAAKRAEEIARLEQELQRQKSLAENADHERMQAHEALMTALQRKVTVYAQSEAGRACGLDDVGGLLVNEAVAAANSTIARPASPRP